MARPRADWWGKLVTMELIEFLHRYTNEVYAARDPEAAARFIADPCLRHEHGHLEVMSLADNIARIRRFLLSADNISVTNSRIVADAEHVVSCYEITIGDELLSGIEVFRVVDAKITETWNSSAQPGAWG